MTSIAHQLRSDLESAGEYVVLANVDSGWFAVFESTLTIRQEAAARAGRDGPNLVVYRTRNELTDPRDHYVVPFVIFNELLTDETVAEAKVKSSRRWNLTLKDQRLHVTHGAGYVDVSAFFRVPLLGEVVSPPARPSGKTTPLQFQSKQAIEGIARELRTVARSRSSPLRDAALRASGGVCEACGLDFSVILGGLGARALQVHHMYQLAHAAQEVVTKLEDLAVVCANCHALLHADRERSMPVHELRSLWRTYRGEV